MLLVLAPTAPSDALAATRPAHARWLNAALFDPRWRHVVELDADARAELARDYGVSALLPGQPQGGATIPVTTCSNSGSGSLRDAVANAASGDTVDASMLTCSTITLTSGQIAIAVDDLAIVGPGKRRLTIANGAGTKYDNRLFLHTGTGSLVIAGMTLADGQVSASSGDVVGGCIASFGTLSLGNFLFPDRPDSGVDIRGCRASVGQDGHSALGGAVYAEFGLSMTNSVISGSEAAGTNTYERNSRGGGAYVRNGPLSMKYSEVRDNVASGASGYSGGVCLVTAQDSVVIESSAVIGNRASRGNGGLYLRPFYGSVEIHDSTIAANASPRRGGLIVIQEPTSPGTAITSSTISINTSESATGAGLVFYGASLTLDSVILSGNVADLDLPNDLHVGADAVLQGHSNLIGTADAVLPADSIRTNAPQLAAPAYNGGATRTMALDADSPARDHGSNANNEDYDQRGLGYPRLFGPAPDIGAYELDPDRIFASGFD